VVKRLESLAAKEQVHLATLASAGLREFAEWGAVYHDYGLAAMSKRLIRTLFDSLPESQARSLGRQNGRDESRHLVVARHLTFNLENVLEVFGNILGRYSGAFIFEHSKQGPVHTVVLRHELGKNASAYYAEYAKAVCELLNMPAAAAETEDQVVITATEPITGLISAGKHLPGLLIEKSPS
jgi:hypothetical protein